MSSHLTISVELIAFMKWILKNKQATLNAFITQVMDEQLRAEIDRVIHDPQEMSGDVLYQIVNSFLGHIEGEMMSHLSNEKYEPNLNTDSSVLYHSLSPQMQAQLTQAFDDEVLSQGVNQAATTLSEHAEPSAAKPHSDQVKKHVLMRSLLNNWSPPSDDEVN